MAADHGRAKRILLQHSYGVDIDIQAVETSKLSLLLKVLEGESGETLKRQLALFKERALPDLGDNIKCGNSLIGPDFYDGQQMGMFDEEEQYRINVFDWQAEFAEIMQSGGFDVVIGNPPYRRELNCKNLMAEIFSTPFGKKFQSPRMDLWYFFVHRGMEILKRKGKLSYIVSAYWTAGTGAQKLIKALKNETQIEEIFFFSKLKVFSGVSGQHMIFRIAMDVSGPTTIKLVKLQNEKTAESFIKGTSLVKKFTKEPEQLFSEGKVNFMPSSGEILSKINKWFPLNELGDVRQGIAENPSVINKKTSQKYGNTYQVGEGVFVLDQEELSKLKIPKNEQELLRDYLTLKDLGRYTIRVSKQKLIYSTRYTCPNISIYPVIKEHLNKFRPIMAARCETLKGSNSWWHLHWPRDETIWQAPKIISIQMAIRPSFVPVFCSSYAPFSVNVYIPIDKTKKHLCYISALLNSKLLWYWFTQNAKQRGVNLEINGNVFSRSPIRKIDFLNNDDNIRYGKIVVLVDRMLDLNKKLAETKTDHDKTVLQRQIDATDQQIDQLVYELYNLTKAEIKIVEESVK